MPLRGRAPGLPALRRGPISCALAADLPHEVTGLWSAGFIANRREIAARAGAAEESSDLELAAALYARLGDEAARALHGPFAWIVWDGDRRRLIAVRDRLGINELYYTRDRCEVLVAADVETLLEGSGPPALNPRAVRAQVQGEAPCPAEIFYEGIAAVPPGSMLVVTHDRHETAAYWRPEASQLLELPDDAAYGRAFRELFLPIVAQYADGAEVGVTLSGGLDSTTVAAAVREAAPRTGLTAFTWTAPELPEADESVAAAAVCRQLDCRTITIPADRHWPLRSEPGIRPERVTPFFNFFTDLWDATFSAAREQGVRVLFSGLSGDHLFGGDVFSYPDLLLTGRWRRLAAEVGEQQRHSALSASAILRWMALAPVANAYLPGLERDRSRPPLPWLGEALRQERPPAPPPLSRRLLPGRRERLRLLRDPLLREIAALLTRQAARHGIELRHPLLDHRLFDFAAALPTAQSFAAGKRKMILRHAMRSRLPAAVLDRRDKTYMAAIVRRGLRERERAKVWALTTDMRAVQMGYVDQRRLRDAYTDYLMGRTESTRFWHTLTLEAWLRRYAA
jgi:asparagine synthase (glutamine-hydrolysing)